MRLGEPWPLGPPLDPPLMCGVKKNSSGTRVTGPLSYGCALVISNIVRHNYKVNHNTLKHTTIIHTYIVTSLHAVTPALWNSVVSPSGEWMCSGVRNRKNENPWLACIMFQ